ncbi:MAG TPA: hypothetical protein VFM37_01435 [Pseudonocardiaceae bacterium]|nr:hypothetical protein [Pseudonocardiaceae bacterium]
MAEPTPRQVLIEERLGYPLKKFVAERYPAKSWRAMAAELTQTTGVQITGESLRLWFADRVTVKTRVA